MTNRRAVYNQIQGGFLDELYRQADLPADCPGERLEYLTGYLGFTQEQYHQVTQIVSEYGMAGIIRTLNVLEQIAIDKNEAIKKHGPLDKPEVVENHDPLFPGLDPDFFDLGTFLRIQNPD
jgi:hypothetical protein